MKQRLNLEMQRLEMAAAKLKAIAHPLRLAIIELLAENTHMTVTELFERLGASQPVVSIHLTMLRQAGYVTVDKIGRNAFYTLKPGVVEFINKVAKPKQGVASHVHTP